MNGKKEEYPFHFHSSREEVVHMKAFNERSHDNRADKFGPPRKRVLFSVRNACLGGMGGEEKNRTRERLFS